MSINTFYTFVLQTRRIPSLILNCWWIGSCTRFPIRDVPVHHCLTNKKVSAENRNRAMEGVCVEGAAGKTARMERTLIRLPLLPQFPRGLDGSLAPVLLQVLIRHYLTTDEFILKIRTICDDVVISVQWWRCRKGGKADIWMYTHWITPAACGALVPFRIVHARTSSGPQVKYRMS